MARKSKSKSKSNTTITPAVKQILIEKTRRILKKFAQDLISGDFFIENDTLVEKFVENSQEKLDLFINKYFDEQDINGFIVNLNLMIPKVTAEIWFNVFGDTCRIQQPRHLLEKILKHDEYALDRLGLLLNKESQTRKEILLQYNNELETVSRFFNKFFEDSNNLQVDESKARRLLEIDSQDEFYSKTQDLIRLQLREKYSAEITKKLEQLIVNFKLSVASKYGSELTQNCAMVAFETNVKSRSQDLLKVYVNQSELINNISALIIEEANKQFPKQTDILNILKNIMIALTLPVGVGFVWGAINVSRTGSFFYNTEISAPEVEDLKGEITRTLV